MVADGGSTCVSLPVATLRSQRLFSPLSSITVSTYLPSGEIEVTTARLEFVTWVMAKFWKGIGSPRCSSQYKPTAAAATTMSAPVAAAPYQRRRGCTAGATVALPLAGVDCAGACDEELPSALAARTCR